MSDVCSWLIGSAVRACMAPDRLCLVCAFVLGHGGAFKFKCKC
jgi:hypothetical protein